MADINQRLMKPLPKLDEWEEARKASKAIAENKDPRRMFRNQGRLLMLNKNGQMTVWHDGHDVPITCVIRSDKEFHFYVNGFRHRLDGPAKIWLNRGEAGNPHIRQFWIDDKEVAISDFMRQYLVTHLKEYNENDNDFITAIFRSHL